MSTLTTNSLTLVELAKRTKDGNILKIAEVLNETNAILDDAAWVRGNGETSHTTTKRLSLPTGSWRKINEGVAMESSRTRQIVESLGMLEAYSQVDQALVDLSPDSREFRMSEDMAFVEGMSQTLAVTLMYGSRTQSPEEIDGFAVRYATLTTAGVSSVHNVHDNGGSGEDLTSVWLVQWGPDKVHLFYPRNSESVGLDMKDDGLITVYDSHSVPRPYKAYQTHFKVYAGLAVRDDRCIQRICNIETTGTTSIFDEDYVIQALREMPNGGAGAVMYANKTVLSQMDIAAKDKTNVRYGPEDVFGRPTMTFRGIPVRQVDAIHNKETQVS